MPLVLEALTYHRGSDEPLSVLVILVVRVTLVVATGWLVSRAVSQSSAAVEHRVWLLAVIGTLVVPIVWALTPGWRVPLVAVLVEGAAAPIAFAAAPATHESGWPELLVAVWITGTLVGLGYTVLGIVAARRLFRGSRACRDSAWLAVLAVVEREMGPARRVELRIAPRSMSPAVWSFRRVQILVPEESLAWPLGQRKSVLLHELAHVARRDCASQMIANLACAAWWFHPLVWYAASRMRALGEQAADDHVIRAGGDRADYAGHLLAIARALDGAHFPGPAQTMFHPSHLERRLRAILDPARQRDALDGRRSMASILIAATLMIPLAMWTPSVVRAVPPATSEDNPPRPVSVDPIERITAAIEAFKSSPRYRLLRIDQRLPAQGRIAPAPAAPPVFQLIPNWDMGSHAEMLIPNYEPGTVQIRLVAQLPPQQAARLRLAVERHAAGQQAVATSVPTRVAVAGPSDSAAAGH